MSNPVLVEVTRGPLVESRHCGAVSVRDAEGRSVLAVGDVAVPVFPRSAIKALQAIALVESGAADRYGFGDEALALACASHSGEPAHMPASSACRRRSASMLPRCAAACIGRFVSAAYALAQTGTASALHNNCSGRDAGFLCLACAMAPTRVRSPSRTSGAATSACRAGRLHRRRPWGRCLRHRWLLGADLGGVAAKSRMGLCQIRYWSRSVAEARRCGGTVTTRMHLKSVVRRRHRESVPRSCSYSAARCCQNGRRRRLLCRAAAARAGIAIKCDDGAARAAQAIMAAMIARFLTHDAAEHAALRPFEPRSCATGTAPRLVQLE